MKINSQGKFGENQLVVFKDENWLANQKHAGRCVAACLRNCGDAIKSGVPGLNVLDLVRICEAQFDVWECEPTFFNYKGGSSIPFPSKICVSINSEIVHGIAKDRLLEHGDIVKIDLGATHQHGEIADAARTFIYGEPKSKEHVRLIHTCWEALKAGIKVVEEGKQIGVIGHAIFNSVKNSGFGLITQYGGHSINSFSPHAEPFIANKSQQNEGIRIQQGLTLAIEPQLLLGQDTSTKVLNDGWTVVSKVGHMAAHFEDTIILWNNEIHNITEIMHETY